MSPTYSAGGAILNYVDEGNGATVVFLHPTPLDHDYWRPVVAEIPGLRAIVPDLRGHGASELGENLPTGSFARVPDAPVLTMGRLASDVFALLDRLYIDHAVVVGCSIGGYVLLEMWRRNPQRMQGLGFICSKPQADGEAALKKREENIRRVRAEGVDGFFDGLTQTLLSGSARRRKPALAAEARARMTLSAEAVVAVQAGLAVRPDSLPTVRTIDVPVLSIAGGEDVSVSPAEMEAFQAAPGGCSAHVLEEAGHFAAYEQPEMVAACLIEWIKGKLPRGVGN